MHTHLHRLRRQALSHLIGCVELRLCLLLLVGRHNGAPYGRRSCTAARKVSERSRNMTRPLHTRRPAGTHTTRLRTQVGLVCSGSLCHGWSEMCNCAANSSKSKPGATNWLRRMHIGSTPSYRYTHCRGSYRDSLSHTCIQPKESGGYRILLKSKYRSPHRTWLHTLIATCT